LTPAIPDDCPSLLREVMEMCWKKEPDQRPVSFIFSSILSQSYEALQKISNDVFYFVFI
jgi:hypothetical protein